MRYDDITIEVAGQTVPVDGKRVGKYSVRVLQSPVGEMKPEQAVPVEFNARDLQRTLDRLDRRELDRDGMIALGRTLAAILLPPAAPGGGPNVMDFLRDSLVKAGPDEGVRLRLRLPNELSVVPWEYAFVEREGSAGMDGFLALDPRVAIVRHEVMASPATAPLVTGNIKVVAVTAAPDTLPELDLDREMEILTDALHDVHGVALLPCEHATLAKLQPLLTGTAVFHFAGHGDFTKQMGALPGTYTGTGFFAFEDQSVDAEQIGINLRGNGIRLAVLGGCNTGRRDGVNVWSGIAPALVKAGVAAVVANQYAIQDTSALAFTRGFYEALSGGLPLERAVTAGRIAVYNADPAGRDWGVPVLYLRASGDGQLFKGAADSAERDRARKSAEGVITLRAREVKAGGILTGAEIGRMLDGNVVTSVTVAGDVLGAVTGVAVDDLSGGRIDSTVDVGSVGAGGTVVGANIETVGFGMTDEPAVRAVPKPAARPTTRAKPPASRAAPPPPAPPPMEPQAPGGSLGVAPPSPPPPAPAPAPAPQTTASVSVGTVSGGTVIGTQTNDNRTTKLADTVQIGSVTIVSGGPREGDDANFIEEKVRLDVALPTSAVVDEPFDVVVAVKQPNEPTLSVTDLDQVRSAEGHVFRADDDAVVRYRVEVTGAGLSVVPPHYVFRLRAGESSSPIAFQVTALRPGKRSLLVNAYQEDDMLAAQTRLSIEAKVAVAPS